LKYILTPKKIIAMTLMKVNNRNAKTWNGLVNDLFTDFDQVFGPWNGLPANSNVPPVNIYETNEAYWLELSVPGRKKELFTLNVEDNTLTVGYEDTTSEEQKDTRIVRKEFAAGNFKRVFNLGEQIDTNEINAKYENGLLKVTLARKKEIKPQAKQINVQ
jgi:HSP20 family protein